MPGEAAAASVDHAAGHAAAGPVPGTEGQRVFAHGVDAYARILARIAGAKERIELRAFVWRDDDTGRAVARALLEAADRGVRIDIHKDRVAASYEYHGGTRQSLFHKRIGIDQRLQTWFLDRAYATGGSLVQQPSPEAAALLTHPNIRIEHAQKRFDHAKVWVFDEEAVILGGMGIGDEHCHEWVDFMVELEGRAVVSRLRARLEEREAFSPERPFDFLCHSRAVHGTGTCPMLGQRLALIGSARESLDIAMAYLGDARFTEALLAAIARGVRVSLITSSRADVMGNINRATCNVLRARAARPELLQIYLHPRVVHAKAIVIDGRVCDVGSANFTPLSHGVYDEVNVFVNDPAFARKVQEALRARAEEAVTPSGRIATAKTVLLVERAVVAYMARRARKARR